MARDGTVSRPTAPRKSETALLPPFAGLTLADIHLPASSAECEAAVEEILAAGRAGFNTEPKPRLRAGQTSGGPHLVQFAVANKAYLFQLHRGSCESAVSRLIESEALLKVGFGLKFGQIQRRLGISLNGALDLARVFRELGYKDTVGVRGAVGAILEQGFEKPKSISLSNWAAAELRPEQLLYAANDAYAALKVTEALEEQGRWQGSVPRRPTAPTKAETALLPPFAGLTLDDIHLPASSAECEAAVEEILAAGRAGFDTEAKPTFRAGQKSRGPHLVQFALTDRAYLFQLHRGSCESAVSRLIESEALLKVGFGLKNDSQQIRRLLGISLNRVLDLATVFRELGYKTQVGIRGAVGAILEQRFEKPKSISLSNWAAAELSPSQLLYAANDAYAALKVTEALGEQWAGPRGAV